MVLLMHYSTLCLTFCLWLLLKGAQYSYRLVGGGASSDHHMILTHFSPTLELQRFNYMWMEGTTHILTLLYKFAVIHIRQLYCYN